MPLLRPTRARLAHGAPLLALVLTPVAFAQTSSLDGSFQTAVAAFHAGHFAEAATRLEALEPHAPKSFELHELLGLTYGALARTSQAIAQLGQAAQLHPNDPAAHTNLATALATADRSREAEVEYRRALALDPKSLAANHDLADLLLRENRVGDALPLLEAAHSLKPDAPEIGYNLALAYVTTQHVDQARQLISKLEAQHDSGELHALLARLDEQTGQYIDAANQFAAAARMDPSEENLFAWASDLLLHRAYEAAITVFADATGRFPSSPRLWVGLGMANYSRGLYEPAIKALLTAADLNPHDPRCYLFLSKAYLSSPSQAEQVIECFRRYHALEPNNALAAYYEAVSLWKGRRVNSPEIDYKTVQSLLQQSIALDPKNPEVHLQLGILYTDQHLYDQALPEYQAALRLNPNLADAHFRLGRYFLHAGDKDKAQTELDTFKKLQAQHQAEVDKERAEVQQFVIADNPQTPAPPQAQP